jgi:ABC transporter substrate binding protein (PQQ-dependent alcohol dehydrogenase system)
LGLLRAAAGRRGRSTLIAGAAALLLGLITARGEPADAADPLAVDMAYITQEEETLLPLSLLDYPVPADLGQLGAAQALTENQTTGSFLGHDYSLDEVIVPADGDLVQAFKDAVAKGERLFIADLHADQLLTLADLPEAEEVLLLNSRAEDDELRTEDCRANLFHIMPSRAMKADALAQYLVWKQWRNWFLMHGTQPADLAYKAAIERAGAKFGAKIVETREYEYQATARRTDSGHVQIQRQMPVLTQDAPEHDVLMVADESDIFGEYLSYQAWTPRPVAGTQGLIASAWHRSQEQWGATQVQRRFFKFGERWILERDYTAWLAVRILGEAVTRTSSTDTATLRDYLRSDQFEIAAFKGEGLTFRSWNQQLRQPVLVVGPRMLVSVSPQDQFLHQRTPLDTLGYDQPESQCALQ